MEALPGTIPTRAMAAQRAGIDIVLHCNGNAGEMHPAEVLERPTPKTRQRMQAAIGARDALVPQSLDIDALHAQRCLTQTRSKKHERASRSISVQR